MKSRTIPSSEWQEFTDGFSRRHEGEIVSLFTEPHTGQRADVARDVALRGVAIDTVVGQPSVVVTVDGGDDRRLSHTISKPARIVVEENNQGAEIALAVASEFGTAFTIEFRVPKEAVMNELKDSLRDWGFDAAAFEAKAKQSIENARGDLSEITGILRQTLAQTKQTLLDLQKSREPIAQELKNGFERAWDEIENAFARARRRMRETVEAARAAGD